VNARLASTLFVTALLRNVHTRGGAGILVARGDETAGAILIICRQKGRLTSLCEQRLAQDGRYVWAPLPLPDELTDADLDSLCRRRRQIDPDLWIVELDIANAERFIAEMSNQD
jgi:hypothetical protein